MQQHLPEIRIKMVEISTVIRFSCMFIMMFSKFLRTIILAHRYKSLKMQWVAAVAIYISRAFQASSNKGDRVCCENFVFTTCFTSYLSYLLAWKHTYSIFFFSWRNASHTQNISNENWTCCHIYNYFIASR